MKSIEGIWTLMQASACDAQGERLASLRRTLRRRGRPKGAWAQTRLLSVSRRITAIGSFGISGHAPSCTASFCCIGHRGSGLSVVVQMLGALCGGPVISPGTVDMAYFVIVIDPKIFLPDGEYPVRVNELADEICSARPIDPHNPVRMPFARSAQLRRQNLKSGDIEVPDVVHAGLVRMLNS